jgi:hypothetical protein
MMAPTDVKAPGPAQLGAVAPRAASADASVRPRVAVAVASPRRPARTRRAPSRWSVAAGSAIVGFLAVQVVIVFTAANGPTLDEGIYLTAGRRTLDGSGIADSYLAWFAGSLLWPVVAALGEAAAGLAGARLAAAVLVTIGLAGSWRAAAALFGRRAGFFTAVAAIVTAPAIALGHLAVIDAPAVAGIGLALWAITELARRDRRGWLVAAALAYAVAVLGKYPAAACGVPLLLLLVLLRGRRAPTDLAIFAAITAAVLTTYFVSQRGQLGYFVGWRATNNPTFGVTREMAAVSQAWNAGLPLLLGVGGLLVCRAKAVAAVLLGGALIFPAYHLATGSSVGDTKHVVLGCVFTLPLAGLLLARIARRPAGAAVAACATLAMGAFAAVHAQRLDASWMDVSPAADYLAAAARPGDRFLIDNAWPFTRRLYADGKVRTPWSVYDVYRVAHGQNEMPVCRFDWFVAAHGADPWPPALRRAVERCGTFERVYVRREPVTAIGRDLRFTTWDASVEIFRNARAGRR